MEKIQEMKQQITLEAEVVKLVTMCPECAQPNKTFTGVPMVCCFCGRNISNEALIEEEWIVSTSIKERW